VSVTAAKGWKAAGVRAGTKPSGELDLALVVSDTPATVAGAFTTSSVPSAHVIADKPRVSSGRAQGFCVTAGIANAFTGRDGVKAAEEMASTAARLCGFASEEDMLVAATGTIGVPLPMDVISAGLAKAAAALSETGDEDAANAIRTTDAYVKTCVRTFDADGLKVTVGGMAKGAGMIAPRMVPQATLLVFLTTDAAASPDVLRGAITAALPKSFNAITVDGCMSTSDTVLVLANGLSGVDVAGSDSFVAAVTEVMADLAYKVVADGEGATRVIRVQVTGAATDGDAYAASREIATSILVRCAIYGGDPNYGRIVQALGQASVALDPDKLRVGVGGVALGYGGSATGRADEAAKALGAGGDAIIEADLGLGGSSFEYLTCDLTPEYVKFNADYTT
jgi:glutamate N-acetyltransferase/amino-acid N-acetyltransferase